MARVLILSSLVATGHVGLSAARPVLERLGHAVTGLPSVLLSNHPGFGHVAGGPVPVDQLRAMIDAIEANGWLGDHDAVLTGYLPGAPHVDLAVDLIARIRRLRPGVRVTVDPILGDRPKGLYLAPAAAGRLREALVPLADVLTPNAFELGWLTGRDIATPRDAIAAARTLAAPRVVVTSPPFGDGLTGALDVTAGAARRIRLPDIPAVPQGTGDALAAMIAAGLPLDRALGHLHALIDASAGAPHLRIAEAADRWTRAPAARYAPDTDASQD